eukprot:gene1079-1367_t
MSINNNSNKTPYFSENARQALFEGREGYNNNNSRKWGQETEQTSQYTNQQILDRQKQEMLDQDKHLDALSYSVGRTKEMAIQIGTTADQHSKMLDELDIHVDSTTGRLKNATKNVIKITNQSKTTGYWIAICILFLVLIVVIALATSL